MLSIAGAQGASIVDISSGMALASGGSAGYDLEVAAAGNSNVIRANLATLRELGVGQDLDDILMTLDTQYHLVKILEGESTDGLFLYLLLDREQSNLALARHKLRAIARDISV